MSKSHRAVGSCIRNLTCAVALTIGATALLAAVGLSATPSASAASWEMVQNFAPPKPPSPPEWPEDVQLGGVSGMAVNVTGSGGVPPGTLYTAGFSEGDWHAARYSPDGKFEFAWTATHRCGPKAVPPSSCPAVPIGNAGGVDIALDQTTGNLYVFFLQGVPNTVLEYRPDGTGPIAEFAEPDRTGSVSASPGKVHGSPLNENIAVDNTGAVYIFDEDTATDGFHRLMMFEPCTPGNYESYCYSGQSHDIGGGFVGTNLPARPVVDDAGNVYVAGEKSIEQYNPAQPATPLCTFSLPGGGISSMTVNPATGAPFYYTSKPERLIHQLSPCNAEGKFVEKDPGGQFVAGPPFSAVPQRGNIEALAFNPVLQRSEEAGGKTLERPPGVLYAGAAEPCPHIGSCPEPNQSSLGYIFAPPLKANPPSITSESVTGVRQTSAILNAVIDPEGSQTRYAFQYITDAAYRANDPSSRFAGATEAPVGGGELGGGNQPLPVSVTISGLAPGLAYRYRVIATSTAGAVPGAAELFATFPVEAEGLPDARAYELVSPAQKNGGEVLPGFPNKASCGVECKPGLAAHRFPVQVAPSGEAVAYQGQPFLLNEGSPEYDEYVSTRDPSGWQTVGMSPPLVGGPGGVAFEAFGLDANLTRGLTYATNDPLVPEAPGNYRNIFDEPTRNRFDLNPLLTTTPPHRPANGSEAFQVRYVGATPDLSRVFFEANDALTAATGSAPAAVDGGASKFNLYEWHAGQLTLVNVQPLNAATVPGAAFGSGLQLADPSHQVADFSNAISADGSRVFWSSESGQVYVRENGLQTREILDHTGKFLSAATNGSKVLLSDGVVYDLETGALTDVTAGSGGFQGIVGQSDDLSSIYFVATSIVTEEANDQGATAEPGQDNLYAWREGVIRFVGTLLPTDLSSSSFNLWSASPVLRAGEASPDGDWLAFNSKASLTGANTTGACELDPVSHEKYVGSVPCEVVYLYNIQSGSLRCASCNPTGAAPLGGSFLRVLFLSAASAQQPQYLTNDGRLYFDSRDALSSNDTNGGVEDVYQYEPTGIGSCAISSGCVSLISSGRGAFDSNFLSADPSGDNVFFTTRLRLVPRDQDELIDLYDARVGGGIAADYATPRSECSGEACQAPPPPLLTEPSPSSSTFEGAGNLKPKKHHKKRHHKKRRHHSKKNSKNRSANHGRRAST